MGHIGWLAHLANASDQPYNRNNTGGPSIKVIKKANDTKKVLLNLNSNYLTVTIHHIYVFHLHYVDVCGLRQRGA